MKREGITIEYEKEFPQFLFLGDTTAQILDNDALEKYPTIIIECTYFDEESLPLVGKKGNKHIHWYHLRDYVVAHPETLFVLIHFSHKYTSRQICTFFDEEISNGITNIHPWVKSHNTS